MDKIELDLILEKHKKWISGENGGCRANLSYADLCGADLCGANLCGADLRNANLCGADLRGADLCDASLWGCVGNSKEIKSIFISEIYQITYTSAILQIGCEQHKIDGWWKFKDEEIKEMDGDVALSFWRNNKDFIKDVIEKYPATPINRGD